MQLLARCTWCVVTLLCMVVTISAMFLSGIVGDGVAGAEEPASYAPSSDFFFQVVFRRGCHVNRIWCGRRAYEVMGILGCLQW